MRLMYTKPKLRDLSQGSRIAFARQFRLMTQDDVSDKLGITGECKRRTMTRYEKCNRTPKSDRTLKIAQILDVNVNSLKKYDYVEITDIIYTLMWLEEIIPNYIIDLNNVPNINNKDILIVRKCIDKWNIIRNKRAKREISYEEYIEWKLNYNFDEEINSL